MADLNLYRLKVDGNTYAIPEASTSQKGLMSVSDFNKLAGIEESADVNKIETVQVNSTALAIANKIVNILIATGTANGTIAVNNVDVAVRGLAALAYKANVSKSDLDTALQTAFDAKAESSTVSTLSGKIDTLNGTGVGSVKKAIDDAFDDFSTKVTNDGVVNSYKELIDWAASHGSDATEMASAISTLEGLLAGIGGTDQPATVKAAITAAIEALNLGTTYATQTSLTNGLNGKVDKVTGYGLSKNDFTDALLSKLNNISENATKNTYSYDSATGTLELTGFSAAAQ